ncbi:Conserved_hypothetical protein [Hexamita inflata]|uniref:Uncharacterized protein n=1 Tax=Hexamita inflata TaxID=28002 RepID=A0AA86URD8_9EUKA|nr:Conserved hypothetical protein [Hexamita inflata]
MEQISKLLTLTTLQLKKLMIKRRQQIIEYYISPYQFQVAKNSISLKNSNLLRQLRINLDDLQYQNSSGQTDIYKDLKNQLYWLLETTDDYNYYQIEYFRNKIYTNTQAMLKKTLFLIPSYIFNSQTSSLYFQQIIANQKYQTLHSCMDQLKDSRIKCRQNTVFMILYQVVEILSILHQSGLCLNGQFDSLILQNERIRLDFTRLKVRVPDSLNDGILQDIKLIKKLFVDSLQIINQKQNQQIILLMNDAFQVLNDCIDDNMVGLVFGMELSQVTSLVLQMPFMHQRNYPHFQCKELKFINSLDIQLVEAYQMPVLKEIKIQQEQAQQVYKLPTPTFFFQNRAKSAAQYQQLQKQFKKQQQPKNAPADFVLSKTQHIPIEIKRSVSLNYSSPSRQELPKVLSRLNLTPPNGRESVSSGFKFRRPLKSAKPKDLSKSKVEAESVEVIDEKYCIVNQEIKLSPKVEARTEKMCEEFIESLKQPLSPETPKGGIVTIQLTEVPTQMIKQQTTRIINRNMK